MVIAQTLKDQYRFAFLNTVRGDWQELTLSEVIGRAKAIYPASIFVSDLSPHSVFECAPKGG